MKLAEKGGGIRGKIKNYIKGFLALAQKNSGIILNICLLRERGQDLHAPVCVCVNKIILTSVSLPSICDDVKYTKYTFITYYIVEQT